jgi:hypothetical protein
VHISENRIAPVFAEYVGVLFSRYRVESNHTGVNSFAAAMNYLPQLCCCQTSNSYYKWELQDSGESYEDSTQIRAATNSDPYVAVSTVACFLEYQSIGVMLARWRIPVTYLPVTTSCIRFAST